MFNSSNKIPAWVLLSLAANAVLILTVIVLLARGDGFSSGPLGAGNGASNSQAAASEETASEETASEKTQKPKKMLGPRHQWTYEQWVAQLGREAKAAAENKPERLTILAGDSITLWFPSELLPPQRSWLNQGISGETSGGLLSRLSLFEETSPETIFVMIGINDLLRGEEPETVLENSRKIVSTLRWVHPEAQIVLQSILPHSAEGATWDRRDRLLSIPNELIREINLDLEAIALVEGAYFLNLNPLLSDPQGKLRLDLTTDGLHLNRQGYLVWRGAIELFSQLELN
ncbi:MAG: hypothetical protein F6J93_16760 [Oscillatoria sp. SIO1A7]|nr:hypothetical protein [Oscillatoria sp. SIO1A7]